MYLIPYIRVPSSVQQKTYICNTPTGTYISTFSVTTTCGTTWLYSLVLPKVHSVHFFQFHAVHIRIHCRCESKSLLCPDKVPVIQITIVELIPELEVVIFLRSSLYEWLPERPVVGCFFSPSGCLGLCQENELLLLFDMLLLIDETWSLEPFTCGVICLWDLMRSAKYGSKARHK